MKYYLIMTYKKEEKEFFDPLLANRDHDGEPTPIEDIDYFSRIILLNEKKSIEAINNSTENPDEYANQKPLLDLIFRIIEEKYLEKVKSNNCEMVVTAIHFKAGGNYLKKNEIQNKLNEKLSEYREGILDDHQKKLILDKMQIVYFSTIDEYNPFAKQFYSYSTLFEDKDDDEFPKFLKLLDARAEGKEAEFFDLKKKIDDIYHVFSLKALACKGIMKCIKREKYGTARNYQLQSFGNKSFIEILKELKKDKLFIDDRINGKLNELNPEYYEELSYYKQLSKYFKWYNEFLNILVDKKKEVEKGE